MTRRGLIIALVVSVALNAFALATAATLWAGQARAERQVEQSRSTGRDDSVREILAAMDPAVRDRVRGALRMSAQAAKPDFDAARQARREAIALARGEAFDPTEVAALLERSRLAEMRGRERLETEAVSLLQTLSPDDRQALSVLLNRHRRDKSRDRPIGGPVAGQAAGTAS